MEGKAKVLIVTLLIKFFTKDRWNILIWFCLIFDQRRSQNSHRRQPLVTIDLLKQKQKQKIGGPGGEFSACSPYPEPPVSSPEGQETPTWVKVKIEEIERPVPCASRCAPANEADMFGLSNPICICH